MNQVRVFVEKTLVGNLSLAGVGGVEVIPIETYQFQGLDLKENEWLIIPNGWAVSLRGGRRYTNSIANIKPNIALPDANIAVIDPKKINTSGYKEVVNWINKSVKKEYVPPKKKKSSENFRYKKESGYFTTGW